MSSFSSLVAAMASKILTEKFVRNRSNSHDSFGTNNHLAGLHIDGIDSAWAVASRQQHQCQVK